LPNGVLSGAYLSRRAASPAEVHPEIQLLEQELKATVQELEDVRNRNASANELLDNVKRETILLKEELTVTGRQLNARDEKMRALEQELATARSKVVELSDRLNEITKDLYEARDAICALMSSTCWRATEPLRRVVDRLPPSLTRNLRRCAKFAYWCATPHRLRQRIAYYRHRTVSQVPVTFEGREIKITAIEKMSALFDPKWYRERYREVDYSRTEPFEHYIHVGLSQGFNPNNAFDELWYREHNPDIFAANQHGFEHFVTSGAEQGRSPNPRFDFNFYHLNAGLTRASNIDAFAHYLSHGHLKGIAASPVTIPLEAANAELGDTEPAFVNLSVTVGIVISKQTPEELKRIVSSAKSALARCGAGVIGNIRIFDNGGVYDAALIPENLAWMSSARDQGFAASHNQCMRAAFDTGADVYIVADPGGAFHPNCIRALLAMNRSQKCRALIEAMQFPEEHPKFYDPVTLRTAWVSDICLLTPRLIWEKAGGFDPNFYLYCEDVDLSWAAHRLGFQTLTCPAALFHHDISNHEHEPWRRREMLISSRYLAHKWGGAEFMRLTERLLCEEGFVANPWELPPLDDLPTVQDGARFADFSNGLLFSPVRW
jgi:GT2 family glycosyltransferase